MKNIFKSIIKNIRDWRSHRRIMRMCEVTKKCMATYTPEQREKLYQDGLQRINHIK